AVRLPVLRRAGHVHQHAVPVRIQKWATRPLLRTGPTSRAHRTAMLSSSRRPRVGAGWDALSLNGGYGDVGNSTRLGAHRGGDFGIPRAERPERLSLVTPGRFRAVGTKPTGSARKDPAHQQRRLDPERQSVLRGARRPVGNLRLRPPESIPF